MLCKRMIVFISILAAVAMTAGNAYAISWSKDPGEGPGDWNVAENWDETRVPGADGWGLIANGGTAYIDTAVPDILAFSILGPSTLEMRDGGSLTTTGGFGDSAGCGDTTDSTLLMKGGTLNLSNPDGWLGVCWAHSGSGYLVQTGGDLICAGIIVVGLDSTSYGSYEISGGSLSLAGEFQIGNRGRTGANGLFKIIGDDATIDLGAYYMRVGTLELDIDGGISPINVGGSVELNGRPLDVEFLADPAFQSIPIIVKGDDSPVNGTFGGKPEGAAFMVPSPSGDIEVFITYEGNVDGGSIGNDVVLTVNAPGLEMAPAEDAFSLPNNAGPHPQTISLPEGETAVGDVLVTLTYDEAVISVDGIAPGGTATIAQGASSVTVSVSAVGTGSTSLTAAAEGYAAASASYEVTGELSLSLASADEPGTPIEAGTPLILDGEYILTVSCDPAVPAESSLELSIAYDEMFLSIEEPAIIDGGNASVELSVTADAATVAAGIWGPPVTVTVSAGGYAPASADYAISFEPGDATDDNCVNVQDLLAIRGQLGKEGSEIDELATDVDGDDKVNVLDLLAVRGALGNGSGCPQ